MKLKAVGAIVSRVKQLILLDDGASQWIGDGYAFYLVPESLGQLTPATVCAIFDVSEDKAANWRIKRQNMPEAYDTTDDGDGREEILVYDLNSRILYHGVDQMPVATPDGKVYFIQARYMKPLSDADPVLTLRYSDKGQPYVIAKAGMFAEAIIMPMASTPALSDWMTEVINGATRARFYEQHELGTDNDDV